MYKLIVLVGISLFGQLLFAQGNYTLEEAVDYAIKNNGNMRIEQLKMLDADGQIKEFKSIGLPKLNANIDYNRNIQIPVSVVPAEFFGGMVGEFAEVQFGTKNTLTGNLQLSALLFDGTYLIGLKAQRVYKDLVSKQIDLKEYEIKSNVIKAYLAVLIAEKNISIIDNNINNLSNLLSETKAVYENGFAEKLDVDRLELSLNNLNTNKENIVRLIELSKNLLKFQMGYPFEEDITLTDNFDVAVGKATVEKIDLAEEIDVNNRPEFKTLEMQEELQKMNLRVIKAGYYPNLVGFISHSQSLQRNKLFNGDEPGLLPATIAGLSLKVPLFDGNEKKGSFQRGQVALETVQIQKEEFSRAMSLQVMNARVSYINAEENVQATKNSLDLSERIYNTTKIKYTEGVGSSIEVSQAEQELYAAQANYINALYDLVTAKSDLEIALGKI